MAGTEREGARPRGVLGYPIRTFRRFCHPEPGADFERPEQYGLSAEVFEVRTSDGLDISGWLFVPERPWGVVVLCHGRYATKSRTLRQTALLYERGLAVATFDFRGCGTSDSAPRRQRPSLWSPLRDLDAVVHWVRGRFGRDPAHDPALARRVALLGCSFGGNMAIAYTGVTNFVFPALILDSTPLIRWGTMLEPQLRRERARAAHPRVRALADALAVRAVVAWTRADSLYRHAQRSAQGLRRTSVLYIAGERDNLYSVEESCRFVARHCAGPAEIWLVPKGRHLTNHLVAPKEYGDRITQLLTAAYARSEPEPVDVATAPGRPGRPE